jgi:transcriptional antiterminator RfaH
MGMQVQSGADVAMQTAAARPEITDPAAGEGRRWFAVHCLPHRESGAQRQLENQGFRTFLPRGVKTRRHARKVETVLVPFFARYLFVQLDLDRHRWRSVNGTFGVASMVMMADRPRPVPHGIVEALIAMADDRDILRFDVGEKLRVGQKIRVLAGPFAEHVGRLARGAENDRVSLLLDIMGGQVMVEVPRETLMAVD